MTNYPSSKEPDEDRYATWKELQDLVPARWAIVFAAVFAAVCSFIHKTLFEGSRVPHFNLIWWGWAALTLLGLITSSELRVRELDRSIRIKVVICIVSVLGSIGLFFSEPLIIWIAAAGFDINL